MQGERKQYGFKSHIAETIHSNMGDTLDLVATCISLHDKNYCLLDKVQVLVIIGRTKSAQDTIFVGDKYRNLDYMIY